MENKESNSTAPAWLDAYSIPDDVFAKAYADVPREIRGQLKIVIARLHVMLGEAAVSSVRSTDFRQGFRFSSACVPAPYAVLLIDSAYQYPAACLAACLPLVSAGIPLIYPCFLDNSSSTAEAAVEDTNSAANLFPALLAGLELAGLSQCYHITGKAAMALLQWLFAKYGTGRLVVLGESFFALSSVHYALEQGIPCQALLTAPIATPCPEGGSPVNDARVLSLLQLDADHDFMWFWPQLSLDWCQQTSCVIQRSKA